MNFGCSFGISILQYVITLKGTTGSSFQTSQVLSNKNPDGTKKKDLVYELFAISNHYGNMGFGHYTAYGKNPIDGKWYDFDDSHVTYVNDPSQIITDAAYNLFYKRKDFSFSGEIDFDSIKQTCDLEDFKLEVSQYSIPEVKETKTGESEANSEIANTNKSIEDEEMNESN